MWISKRLLFAKGKGTTGNSAVPFQTLLGFSGTFSPFSRASDKAMAMAWFGVVTYLRLDFFAEDFLLAAFLAGDFFAGDFFAAGFFVGTFLVAFLVDDFFVADFLVAFLVAIG